MTRAPVCSCGGRLRKASLDAVDLAPLFGLRGVLMGPIPGLRCSKCGETTFEGPMYERMLIAVARSVLSQARILTGEEARFLRKAVLGLTQERLAKRMAIHAITVADWERGERPLSKEHDYELRGVALANLIERLRLGFGRKVEVITEDLSQILTAPRTLAPPRRARRYVIRASEMPAA